MVAAIVAAAVLVAGSIGYGAYRAQQRQALTECRSAVASFSRARKALLDTTSQSPEVQKLIRKALGVDDILDAVADAASAAERTVDDRGCAADATPIQLGIVRDTLNSATASLQESTQSIIRKNASADGKHARRQDGSSSGSDAADRGLAAARQGLQDSLDAARALVGRLGDTLADERTGRILRNGLDSAIARGQQLVDDSGITDTRLFKAAKVTLDEAVSAVNDWIDTQAAKAQ